jgi:hypothetical protein
MEVDGNPIVPNKKSHPAACIYTTAAVLISIWKGLSVLQRILPSDPPISRAATCPLRLPQSRFYFYKCTNAAENGSL